MSHLNRILGRQGVVGLDIGSSVIKLLELWEHKGEFHLQRVGIEPLAPEAIVDGSIMDSSLVVDAIHRLSDQTNLKSTNVAIALSGHSVVIKKIQLPSMPQEELAECIQWEAEQYIPFDINDVRLDYVVLSETAMILRPRRHREWSRLAARHVRPDQNFVSALHGELQRQGVECWLDKAELLPGDDLWDGIRRGILEGDKILLCCSRASLESVSVLTELKHALEKEDGLRRRHDIGIRIIVPLDLDGYLWGWQGTEGPVLRSRVVADFTTWRDKESFGRGIEALLKALRTDRKTPSTGR
jgi:hypothetical protein